MKTSTTRQVSKQAPVRGILSLAVASTTTASRCGARLHRGMNAGLGMVSGTKRSTGLRGSFLQSNRSSSKSVKSRATRIRGQAALVTNR